MTSTPTSFTGGCACGAIRYECTTAPVAMVNCHCRDCQRASGGPYAPVLIVPAAALVLKKGQATAYVSTADSGAIVRREFCPDCGSPLFSYGENAQAFRALRAGSLDDPSWFKPMIDIWTASAQPWDLMAPELPKFPKNPPIGGT